MENIAQKQRKGGKLEDLWLGPYTIHRHLGKGIYELANDKGKILKKKVNVNRLKSFTRRQPGNNPDPESSPPKKRAKQEEEKERCAPEISPSCISLIRNGQWLNDAIINAAQQLMKDDKYLLPVEGLQNPILGQTLSFEVQTGEFVQILHSGGNHWITISTVGTEHAHVRVYDSLRGLLPDDTKKQIASLLFSQESEIILEYANNQVSILLNNVKN